MHSANSVRKACNVSVIYKLDFRLPRLEVYGKRKILIISQRE